MFKYKTYALFLLIVTMCTFTFVKAEEPTLKGKIIYLDPGHGGRDPGAIYKEMKESEINLQLAKQLKNELENYGATVYLTRVGDYDLSTNNTSNHKKNDLSARAKLINESDCELFISIHLNSDSSPTWHGTQIFYTTKNNNNKILAEILQKEFKQKLKMNREIKQIKNMYLFDRINKPGILIEVGFISNENDRYLLKQEEYQIKVAQTIREGITNYIQRNKKET